MNIKKIILAVALVDFTALNVWALSRFSMESLRALVSNPLAILALADLAIALTLAAVWVWADARRRGVSPLRYVLLTAFTGSIGPLAYLLFREAPAEAIGVPRPARA